MNLLKRQMICEKLRLTGRQSYRIVGASFSSFISSDEVLEIVNRARRFIAEPLKDIPSDMRTPEEMSEELGGIVTASQLLTWTQRRTKNVPPHFRFNKQTTRFSSRRLTEWLEARSRIRS